MYRTLRKYLLPFLLAQVLIIAWAFGGSISGTVTDHHNGMPIGGARIMATRVPFDSTMIFAVSDSGGNFILENVPAGQYVVRCMVREMIVERPGLVTVAEGAAVTGIDFQLGMPQPLNNSLTGHVNNGESHLPINGATAQLQDGYHAPLTVRTDTNGQFTFTDIPAATYQLGIFAPGFVDFHFQNPIAIGPDAHLTGYDAALQPLPNHHNALAGHVRDSITGLPITGATIFDNIYTFRFDSLHPTFAWTDSSGYYAFTNMEPGEYMITCRAEGYLPQTVSHVQVADGDTTTLDFNLTPVPSGTVTGTVTLVGGAPVPHASIEFLPAIERMPQAPPPFRSPHVETDSLGRYAAFVPVGNYSVVCMANVDGIMIVQDYLGGPDHQYVVTVSEGQTTSGIDFVLTPPRRIHVTISGHVTDRNANPLEKAVVSAGGDSVMNCSVRDGLHGSAETDPTGAYTLSLAVTAPGEFRFALSAFHRAFMPQFYNDKPAPWLADLFTVKGDTTITGINFALDSVNSVQHNNSISGTVTTSAGMPIPNTMVFAHGGLTRDVRTAVTDSAGQYTIGDLLDDNYLVAFAARRFVGEIYNNVHTREEATLVHAQGAVTGIDAALDSALTDSLGGTIRGILHDDYDRPLAGAFVILTDGSQHAVNSTVSLSDGNYSLTNVRAGQYFLLGTGAGYATSSTPVTVDALDGNTVVNMNLTYIASTSSVTLRSGWNMVSLPMQVADGHIAAALPGFSGQVYRFSSTGYAPSDQVKPGCGYWMRSNTGAGLSLNIAGDAAIAETVQVEQGWNLIGALAIPVSVTGIASNQPGFVTSQFFGYNGGYIAADTLQPGKGYWVKVNAAGSLLISATTSGTLAPITITSTSAYPPPAPGVETTAPSAPVAFALHQNYPNPFNPATRIAYDIPAAVHVTLKVYNVLGVEVATLVNGMQEAGAHQVNWNANGFSSGLYFYKLTAGAGTEMKKMMYLK